jgi:hypothetical protein
VTHTPTAFETEPVWLDEKTLAYLLPVIGIDHESQIPDDVVPPRNLVTGVGVVDVSSNFEEIIWKGQLTELAYLIFLSEPKLIVIDDARDDTVIGLNGQLITVMQTPSDYDYCTYLNTQNLQRLCRQYEKNVDIVDQNNRLVRSLIQSGSSNTPAIVGSAPDDGFIIGEYNQAILHQYNKHGDWIRDWELPDLPRVLLRTLWPTDLELVTKASP